MRVLRPYSFERRRERYIIIFVFKVLNSLAPNLKGAEFEIRLVLSARRGRLCEVPPLNNRAPVYVQTLKESSFSVHGLRLYNCLPRDLRDRVWAMDGFKRGLDGSLATIPDKPSLLHYYQGATGNSIV